MHTLVLVLVPVLAHIHRHTTPTIHTICTQLKHTGSRDVIELKKVDITYYFVLLMSFLALR